MNYLVIGGSSGIGLALVKKLADSGNQVWCASRQKGEIPESVNFIELDVTAGENQLKSQIPNVIDGLAYCPGTINLKPFTRLTEADFLADFKINVFGRSQVHTNLSPRIKKIRDCINCYV